MFSLNEIRLCGRVVRAPKIMAVKESKKAEFTVVTSERFQGKDGNVKERNEFVTCIAWGKQAEVVEQFISENDHVFVSGSFSTDSWEKDGQKHWKSYCKVREVSSIGSAPQKDADPAPPENPRERQRTLDTEEAPF